MTCLKKEKEPKYSIRKYSIGAASALIGLWPCKGKQLRLMRHKRLVV
ncbi:MAG: YSIRK-type signal peptide-containing protein [Streptococcus thermophilus]